MQPYQRLEAWKASHALTLAVYRTAAAFPPDERYGLTSQLRRAATSVTTNTAEGAARPGAGELRRFLGISLGSLAEVHYLLHLARDLDYVAAKGYEDLEALRNRAGKLIWGLYVSVGGRRKRRDVGA